MESPVSAALTIKFKSVSFSPAGRQNSEGVERSIIKRPITLPRPRPGKVRGPKQVKCPECGFNLVLPDEGEDVQCPNCGALLDRKSGDDKLTEEKEATLSETEAEEKWEKDHET